MAKRSKVAKADPSQTVSPGRAPYTELGISGVTRYGAISRVYEEFLMELRGPTGMRLLREQLDNCPITGAMMFAVKYLSRGVSFRLDPAENKANVDSRRAEAVAERIKATLFDDLDVTWPDLMSEHLSMCGFGYAVHEMVFKRCLGRTPPPSLDAATGQPRDGSALLPPPLGQQTTGPHGQGTPPTTFAPSKFNDGWIGFRSLNLRAQETTYNWEWDEQSHARVLQQMAPPDYRIRRIPLAKCLHFRTETAKNNPEGRALIRNSVTSYLYKKNLQNIEAIGAERDLVGYPVITTVEPDSVKGIKPPDPWNIADNNAQLLLQRMQKVVRLARRDEQEGLVIPWWAKFSLVSTGARRAFDINQIITRYEQRIAMSVLADFIMLGHEAVGSKALASTKSALFTSALNSILDSICAVYNRFAIPLLLDLNGVPEQYAPTLAHGDVENIPIDVLADYIQKLAGAGMPLFPDPELQEAVLDIARLPSSGVQDPDRLLDSVDSNDDAEAGAHPQAVPRPQLSEGGPPSRRPQAVGALAREQKRARVLIERGRGGRIRKFWKI